MPYEIKFLMDSRPVQTVLWTNSFEGAKAHAISEMSAEGADKIEIRDDETGALMFHHPRTMRKA